MPVTGHALEPAATACTGPDGMCRVEETRQFGSDASDVESPQRYNTRNATCEHPSPGCNPIRRNKGPVDRSRKNPIDTAKSPRLPPWEIFQRGPPEHQATPSHPGPHRKIFTLAAVQHSTCMLPMQPAKRTSSCVENRTKPADMPLVIPEHRLQKSPSTCSE